MNEKVKELKSTQTQLTEKGRELNSANRALNEKDKELKSKDESQIKGLQKQLKDNEGSKSSAVSAQRVKSKVNYASASFILPGVCPVGAGLATPYLAICTILAVAASRFFLH